jgi:hypothetical protein
MPLQLISTDEIAAGKVATLEHLAQCVQKMEEWNIANIHKLAALYRQKASQKQPATRPAAPITKEWSPSAYRRNFSGSVLR